MNQRPLQELRLRDFRCFREQQTARLAPLTLLVGENSTGKTSFLAATRAMLAVGSYHEDPDFRAPPYDLGSFHEIAYRQDQSRHGGAESFGLGFRCAGEMVEAVAVDATFTLGDGAASEALDRALERRRCVDARASRARRLPHRPGMRERLMASAAGAGNAIVAIIYGGDVASRSVES